MVSLTSLWLPILLSAVAVFIASSIIHMVLRYHWSDWSGIPDEDSVLEAMRKASIPPGDYHFPHPKSQKEMQSPEIIEKMTRGPVGLLTVMPSGPPRMGKQLTLWFLYSIFVGVLVAYLTGVTVAPGEDYLRVFRIAGTAAFLAYAGAEPMVSIWFGRAWRATVKTMFDGLIYALLTAGVFGWLWP